MPQAVSAKGKGKPTKAGVASGAKGQGNVSKGGLAPGVTQEYFKKRKGGKGKGGKGKPTEAAAEETDKVKTIAALPSKSGQVGSNWELLKKVIGATGARKKKQAIVKKKTESSSISSVNMSKRPQAVGKSTEPTSVVALDCEMVGVGPGGERSALARVCMINNDGNVLIDVHVTQKEKVTDYRTHVSGIRPTDLRGEGVITLEEAQEKVAALTKGSTLVGHALHNDLKALLLDHPRKAIRDTAAYPPLMRSTAPGRKPRPRALRHICSEVLGLTIQEGEHSPVDDARAALYIYHKYKREWETEWEGAIKNGTLKKSGRAEREAAKTDLKAVATTAAATRRARMGKSNKRMEERSSGIGFGTSDGLALSKVSNQRAPLAGDMIGHNLARVQSKAKIDYYTRDIRDDPMADL
eukprot:gene24025-9600_t